MTDTKGSGRARRSKAVAAEAPVQAADAPAAPTAAAPAREAVTCANCERKAVYQTDGIATEKRGYCKQHLPANVTRDMLARYRAT